MSSEQGRRITVEIQVDIKVANTVEPEPEPEPERDTFEPIHTTRRWW